jgi:RsiW-degrading membrane proteinase PrsW (M82 family)
MALLALSVAPGIAICIFIYVKDKVNKEPVWLLLISFILGMLSTIPAVMVQYASGISLDSLAGKSYQEVALFAFGIVAVSEELSKYVMVRYFAYSKQAFDDPFDGIVYAVMVSMGFATLENIGYVMQHGFTTGIFRMFISVPAHATFGILMGYYLGLAKFNANNKNLYFFLSVFFPVLFHGAFDFFLFLGNSLLYVSGAFTSFIIAIHLSKKAIRKHQKNSISHFNQ